MAAVGVAQLIPNFDQAPAQAGLDGAQRQTSLFGYFGMSHSLIKVKGENMAGFLRKFLDCCCDVSAFAADERRRLRGGMWQKLGIEKRLKLGLPALLSGKVDSPSTRKHSDESGLARDGWIIPIGRFPEICECFLHDVFNTSVVLHVAAGN